MNNLSKMQIRKPAHEVFEALANPEKMSNYWFSSGSARVEAGKTITWRYEEYNSDVEIQVLEVVADQKIVYRWGANQEGNVVTITFNEQADGSTIVAVSEDGFTGSAEELLPIMLDNKEGWVYMLTCMKAYLEFGISDLRAGVVK